jgi:hypothetical protein
MRALNDWPAPWPPPTSPSRPLPLSRGEVGIVIFEKTFLLATFGGMGMGLSCVLTEGRDALFAVALGGMAGVPLGLVAGIVLALVGSRLLVPYRGAVVAIAAVSGLASCLVMGYLSLGLVSMAAAGSGEGPQSTEGPSWAWLLMSASIAAAVLSPWLVWWYVKRMDPSLSWRSLRQLPGGE